MPSWRASARWLSCSSASARKEPGAPAVPHSVDREEIFVALAGRAVAVLADQELVLNPGDTLIVPAGQVFSLANPGRDPFTAMAVLPVGGLARMPGSAQAFPPPWVV